MKRINSSRTLFFTIAVIMLWIKSYIIYLHEFNLDIQNSMQHFLLFINPISSILVFFSIALFAKRKRVGYYLIAIYSFMSIFLYANIVFYRFNSDFITIPVLTQTSNFGSLGGSIISLVTWTDTFYFVDIIMLAFLFKILKKDSFKTETVSFRQPLMIMLVGMIVFSVNLGLAEADRPQLLKRTF